MIWIWPAARTNQRRFGEIERLVPDGEARELGLEIAGFGDFRFRDRAVGQVLALPVLALQDASYS